jgi:hypothetical protein
MNYDIKTGETGNSYRQELESFLETPFPSANRLMGLPLKEKELHIFTVESFPPSGRDVLRQLTEDREGFYIITEPS